MLMSDKIFLRDAVKDDCRFIWESANDPAVRAVSFSSDEIPWEVHKVWFEKKLTEPSTILLLAENEQKEKIGQLRFEKKPEGYVISVSLVEEFRGKGLGSSLIQLGSEQLFQIFSDADQINAYIKPENRSSIRSFEKAGYKNAGFATINEENDAVLMVKKRNAGSTMQEI
jgi:RimJ/RimL family protein N-acetyltransferase